MTKIADLPTLKVDGGALLFARPQPNPAELEKAKLRADGLVAAYNMIGYDAVGVAQLDLAGGLDFFKGLVKGSKFAWLSANLVEAKNGHPLFTPFITRTLGDTRVAVIGITSDLIREGGLGEAAVASKPWAEVLTPLVAELSRSHDFLILLTDLPPAVCVTVAQQFPTLNLIINGAGTPGNQSPQTLTPTTMLAATEQQGKYAGALEITWNPGGIWGEGKKQSPAQEGLPVTYFNNSFQAMDETVGKEPRVDAIVAQIKRRIFEMGRKEAAATAGGESSPLPDFAGSLVCGSCHQKAAARWQSTKHAGAYATLEKKNRQFTVDCLLCHVTGGTVASTDRLASLPQELRGVGCEVCHGPSRRHAEGKEKGRPRQVPENLCRNCHVPEHDGHFDYARNLELIRCDRWPEQ